ncbi:MAG: insulinase family protein [candidate division Zixibacteria bacterium]|nr:insulinase family protein [candidate division Zixibacteria bacterium]
MKRIIHILTLSAICFTAVAAQTPEPKSVGSQKIAALSTSPIVLNIPEVGKDVERVTLDNGLIIYLYENHRLPLCNAVAMLHCGSMYDSKEKNGLSGLVGTVMRTGGTITVSGDSLNNIMEFIGGSLETNIGTESGSASLSVMSKDLDLGLTLLADLLRRPAFPTDKLELAKTDVKSQIKRRNDDPNGVAGRSFASILYGDHPYGRITEWATVKGITPVDLSEYHMKFFVPNNIILGISGDFDSKVIIEKIKSLFGDWAKKSDPLPMPPAVEAVAHPGVYEVAKDINQAYINIGQIGIKRDNPDRYAVQLMNYILGGGSFTSRLTSRVRSDEGLAYRTGSSFDIGSPDFGTFNAYCQTKAATAHKAMTIMMEEIRKIRETGATAQELKEARDAAINRTVFNFDTPGKIIRSLMMVEFDGWPMDFYATYLDNYRKVTVEDIKRVAQKYLSPDSMTYVVVGKAETYDKPLDDFGKVTTIELAEPSLE